MKTLLTIPVAAAVLTITSVAYAQVRVIGPDSEHIYSSDPREAGRLLDDEALQRENERRERAKIERQEKEKMQRAERNWMPPRQPAVHTRTNRRSDQPTLERLASSTDAILSRGGLAPRAPFRATRGPAHIRMREPFAD